MSETLTMPPRLGDRFGAELLLVAAVALLPAVANAGDTLVDPTRPATAMSDAHRTTDDLRVQAILDRDGQRVAIVGGKLVRPGDRLSWGQVEEITATGVRYIAAGQTRFVALEVPRLKVRYDEAVPAVSRASRGSAP